MQRFLLKSKIHRARVTDANIEYEGSITIPSDLMEAAGLWEGERVLVASIDSGARLETYVQQGAHGSGQFIINGGAARSISIGERLTILSFTLTEENITAKRVYCDDANRIVSVK